jgi:hypothetical protein
MVVIDTTPAATGINYITSPTCFIKIIAPTSERHDGKWNASKCWLQASTDGVRAFYSQNNMYIEGLQISQYAVDTNDTREIRYGIEDIGCYSWIYATTVKWWDLYCDCDK